MTKSFSAIVKDNQTKKTTIITSEYTNKQDFIRDLKNNGYAVNPNKVKESDLFNWILDNTNCSPEEWKYITQIPSETITAYDMVQTGLRKEEQRQEVKSHKLEERREEFHKQLLDDLGMTEEQYQDWLKNK